MAIVMTSGFKAGQSKDGGLGYEPEVSQTLNAKMSALEPTMVKIRSGGIDPVASTTLGIDNETSKTLTCAHGRAGGGVIRVSKVSVGFKGNNSPHARGIGYGKEVSHTLGAQMPGLEPTMMTMSFAQNTREELRKVNGDGKIAGALSANQGTHQTTLRYELRLSGSGIECLCPHQRRRTVSTIRTARIRQ